ncbi:MAG: hypothetical protein ACOY0T_32110 [Myxococcota bacterium]
MKFSKSLPCFSAFTVLLGLAAPATAQTAPGKANGTAAAASAPTPASASESAPSVPPPVTEAAPKPTCRLGVHSGIPEEDASTAASLVCREVEKKPAAGHHYRVDLDRLGTVVYLTLTDEDATGNAASRRMQLAAIEETGDAAPRLADALLNGTSVAQTQRTDNLTETEARAPLRKSGSLQIGVGVMGVYAPSVPTLAPGFELSLRYDTPRWVAHSTLRYAAHIENDDEGNDEGLRVFDWGVGARYMLSTEDFSPFIGGGLAYMAVQRDTHSQNGLGAFGEVGVEMLRLHRNRLGAALRADAPLFSVSNRYVMPLSLAVTFTFN